MEKIPWHRNRTEAGGGPFKAVGDDWCNRCKMGVDADQEARSRGDEFVFRKRCLRCGWPISQGVYRIRMLDGNTPSSDAQLFIRERGKDRT